MMDWNKRNGGFLDDFNVREFQVSNLSQQIDELKQENEDYKSRIEKAIEYIKEARKQDFMWTPIFEKELLNILNSRSDKK